MTAAGIFLMSACVVLVVVAILSPLVFIRAAMSLIEARDKEWRDILRSQGFKIPPE